MVLSIQEFMRDAGNAQILREYFILLDRDGADKYGLTFFIKLRHFPCDGLKLTLLCLEYLVITIGPCDRLVRRDRNDIETVHLVKLFGTRLRRTCHPRELCIHTEIVLKRDGGKSARFLLHLHSFFGLDRLMEALAPAPTGHKAAGKLIDDDDRAILNHILFIQMEDRLGTHGGLKMMHIFNTFFGVDIVNTKLLLGFLDP